MRLDDFLKRGWLYQATGYSVMVSFLFMVIIIVFIPVPEANREIFIHMIGMVEGAFVGNLVNHFFGSAANRSKDTPPPTAP